MANILLLDDNEVACRAMQGILTRSHHRCLIAHTADDAWRKLRDLTKFDLVIIELKLTKGENGIHFLQHLRDDVFLKLIPVVVYSMVNNQEIVKKALSLKIQNYLIKPYQDDAIYAEIEKTGRNPWRSLHFEEERSFCTQMVLKPAELRNMLQELRLALLDAIEPLQECAETKDQKNALARIEPLNERAESAGAWGVVEYLQGLKDKIDMRNWPALFQSKEDLTYASQLIECHLDPSFTPAGFFTEEELKGKEEAKLRAQWMDADVSQGPLVHPSDFERKLDELKAGPVIDSVGAAFMMNVDGRAPSLNQVIELVAKDPWLAAQVLITANNLEHEVMTSIEDIRLAVTMLGYDKLAAMAKTMPLVAERHMQSSLATWAHYWMFQVAVARVAQFTATSLELTNLTANAYTAGLLHDYGRLILVLHHPFSFQAISNYAKKHSLTLHEAEKKYLGWTTREIGDHVARKLGLPPLYCSVIRWVGTPVEHSEHTNLVALVSLARHLCLQNQIGASGEPHASLLPLEETPSWQILQQHVFPSFNLRVFVAQTHSFCATLKQELIGHIDVMT